MCLLGSETMCALSYDSYSVCCALLDALLGLFSQILPLQRQNSVTCKAACHAGCISTSTLQECVCLAQRQCAH